MFTSTLKKFESRYGTGVKVTRTSVVRSKDPSTAIAGGTTTTTTILTGIRFLEHKTRDIKPLLDSWGLQQGKIYMVHFPAGDDIQLEDIVEFNTEKEKQKIAFDATLPITRIRLREKKIGFGDHIIYIGTTQ